MSVDTYFCCCCLSTSELSSIYSCEADKNYAELLKELFRVKILSDDHDDDAYVCDLCAKRLKLAYELKSQVETTLKMLQTYGLIIIEEKDGEMYVTKSSTNFIDKEDKYELETKWLDTTADLKSNIDKSIKEENVELYKDTVQTTTDIVSTASVTKVALESDKDVVSGKKGKKQHEAKREIGYKVNRDFKCEVCEVKLPNVYVYHTHMNGHYPNHICEACGKGFLTERRLKRHMPSHKRGTFKCDSCEAVFTNYNTLCSHRQRKHSSVELYKCPECGLRFATLTRRAQHLAAAHAHPTGTYACRLCNKQFLLSGNLSAHMRNKHLKIKRHHCSECGAGFYHKQELTGHMAVHTGLNQFQCTLCNKRYPRKKALEVHRRIHTNDKRFSCDTCGKKFLQKCTLQSHLKTHAANKPNEI